MDSEWRLARYLPCIRTAIYYYQPLRTVEQCSLLASSSSSSSFPAPPLQLQPFTSLAQPPSSGLVPRLAPPSALPSSTSSSTPRPTPAPSSSGAWTRGCGRRSGRGRSSREPVSFLRT
ncbi:hypothetical protein GSI_00132 [Ganoderma sinense ZZ0214-1]|uniref:Uncharacterized protein n=1 Tax=Ganoderma sinense ZZ0214-1 TaxID=1077348 RepID=A0A2G8SRV5_9APHY|nr:hypothetical protein GSI_00132 [Ganoderma sinense ZZ0214-1]